MEIPIMMIKNVAACAALLFCLTAVPALADSLMGLDRDQDGYVSLEEAKEMPDLANAFMELDANTDGKLDAQEIAVFMKG
jgi:Ca2+-binding EF-hand superfamily protein